MRKEVSLDKATRLINHGPVVLVTSKIRDRAGITPVAWIMPVNRKPPEIALEIGQNHFIYECIMETGEFVVNVPRVEQAEEVVRCGSCSGRDTDKAASFGIILQPSRSIGVPALKESLAALECELIRDEHLLKEYNIVAGKVKYAEAEEEAFGDHWVFESKENRTLHHLGNKTFCSPDGILIDLREKEV